MYKNMHFFILLCAFTAPFIEANKIHGILQNDKAKATENSQASDYGEYELHSIKHKRSSDEITINVKINGVDKELTLLPLDSFFSGDVWIAKKNIETNKFEYTLQKNVMEKVNMRFYQDQNSFSSTSSMVNDEGLPEFNGVVDADKLIRPLQINSRNRRDLSSKLLPQLSEDDISKYHTIIKRSPFSSDNIKNNKIDDINRINVQKRFKMNASNLVMPDVVHPEILVFVDTTLFKAFESNVVETLAYILTLWNGVDLNYRELDYPKVRLSISGIVLCQDQPVPNNPFYVTRKLLEDFSKFLYEQKQFELRKNYDIGVLMGGSPSYFNEVAGRANVAKACADNSSRSVVHSAAVMLDDTKFSGIDTASHELGHLKQFRLTVYYFDGPGAEKCPWADGYLMSYVKDSRKQFEFSSCTKETMSYFFSRKDAECLYNDPATERANKKMLSILPGQYITLNDQCRMNGYKSAWNVNDDICLNGVSCVTLNYTNNLFDGKSTPVLEGTPCGFESYCLKGHCVKITKDNIPNNVDTKILFPRPYMDGLGKSSDTQCKELNVYITQSKIVNCRLSCIDDQPKETVARIVSAQDGTSCGTNNDEFCQNRECKKLDSKRMFNREIPLKKISQNTDSRVVVNFQSDGDTQCQNEGLLAMINATNCEIFCATGNSSDPFARITANNNFPCESGFCVDGYCEPSETTTTSSTTSPTTTSSTTLPTTTSSTTPPTTTSSTTSSSTTSSTTPSSTTLSSKIPHTTTRPRPYMDGLGKSSDTQCKEQNIDITVSSIVDCTLYCIKDQPKISTYRIFHAQDGTSCGTNKDEFCQNGECKKLDLKRMFNLEIPPKKISQNTDSFLSDDWKLIGDEQCKTEGHVAMINVADCVIFCATGDPSNLITIIGANNNFPCEAGFCVGGFCEPLETSTTSSTTAPTTTLSSKIPHTTIQANTTFKNFAPIAKTPYTERPISMTPDIDYNMTKKISSIATTVKRFFNNQSDKDRCSSFGGFEVFKVNKCSVICGSNGKPEILLNYEDGTICVNNGVCYSGICHIY